MKIKLLSEGAKAPTRADMGAAGFDLYVPKDTVVKPGRNIIPLGFCIEVPKGYEASIRPRSGFSAKGFDGIEVGQLNFEIAHRRFDADVCYGTVDETYRGEVGVIVKSYEKKPFVTTQGTRIAQMVITPYLSPELSIVSELSETERGAGGFGSTGNQ